MNQVGLITIGQAPRLDVVPEMKEVMGNIPVLEAGALDGLTKAEIERLAPKPDELRLVSRLTDGSCVTIAKHHADQLVQKRIQEIETQVAAILIICTGEFPVLHSRVPLLKTQPILHHTAKAVCSGKIGVIIPEREQVEMARTMWMESGLEAVVTFASPYGDMEQLRQAASQFRSCGDVDLIVLDCIGFSQHMKEIVQDLSGKPVILPRTLAARVLAELV